jgi:hypothetical protein
MRSLKQDNPRKIRVSFNNKLDCYEVWMDGERVASLIRFECDATKLARNLIKHNY